MRLSVTERVRPGRLLLHFDEGAQAYLQSVYAECDLRQHSRWLGKPTGVAPGDLVNLQELIGELRPDCVVISGAQAGMTDFVDNVLTVYGLQDARIVRVDRGAPAAPAASRIVTLRADPDSEASLSAVRQAVSAAEVVLVLYAAEAGTTALLPSLRAYGELVSHRSFLICLDTLMGQPWLGYSSRWIYRDICALVADPSPFVIDRSWNRHLISTSPGGYLRKLGKPVFPEPYDPSLDDLPPWGV
jgi:cephalosporin hydroxylase